MPATASSGQTVAVTFTVTNQGTRDTREQTWVDRVFLSQDPSLDRNDLLLGEFRRTASCAIGESYTATVHVRLPDGIDGPFYVLATTDSAAYLRPRRRRATSASTSPASTSRRPPACRPTKPQAAARLLARGRPGVPARGEQYRPAPITVIRATPPDLQVTSLVAPLAGAVAGQEFDRHLHGDQPRRRHPADAGELGRPDLPVARPLPRPPRRPLPRHRSGTRAASAAGQSYTVTRTLARPIARPDRARTTSSSSPTRRAPPRSAASSSWTSETNNDRASDVPLVIELPPPADLVVTEHHRRRPRPGPATRSRSPGPSRTRAPSPRSAPGPTRSTSRPTRPGTSTTCRSAASTSPAAPLAARRHLHLTLDTTTARRSRRAVPRHRPRRHLQPGLRARVRGEQPHAPRPTPLTVAVPELRSACRSPRRSRHRPGAAVPGARRRRTRPCASA